MKTIDSAVTDVASSSTGPAQPAARVREVVGAVTPTASRTVRRVGAVVDRAVNSKSIEALTDAVVAPVRGAAAAALETPDAARRSTAPPVRGRDHGQPEGQSSHTQAKSGRGSLAGGVTVRWAASPQTNLLTTLTATDMKPGQPHPARPEADGGRGDAPADGVGDGPHSTGFMGAGPGGAAFAGAAILVALALILPRLFRRQRPRHSACWGPVAFLAPIERPG